MSAHRPRYTVEHFLRVIESVIVEVRAPLWGSGSWYEGNAFKVFHEQLPAVCPRHTTPTPRLGNSFRHLFFFVGRGERTLLFSKAPKKNFYMPRKGLFFSCADLSTFKKNVPTLEKTFLCFFLYLNILDSVVFKINDAF